MFANLHEYKRETHPDTFNARRQCIEEMNTRPQGMFGALWNKYARFKLLLLR